jgi:hypothetical protein
MIPPWIKFPEIPLGSCAWRQGVGESYWYEFVGWFNSLTVNERHIYIASNPPPNSWKRFWPYEKEFWPEYN